MNAARNAARADRAAFADPRAPPYWHGSPKQDRFKAHGSPLGTENVKRTKQTLGWPPDPPFLMPEPALAHFGEALERGAKADADWDVRWLAQAEAFPALAAEPHGALCGDLPIGWDADIPVF